MAEVLAMVMPTDGREPCRLPAADALQGTAQGQDLIGYQGGTGLLSGLLGTETMLDGSDFLWDSRFLPKGRSVYFETFASGSVLTTQNVVSLYADGVLVIANTTTGTTGVRTRSAALALTSGALLKVSFKTQLLGTGTLRYARLIIL